MLKVKFSAKKLKIETFNAAIEKKFLLSKNETEVEFDLYNVFECDPLSACQLFAWIITLLKDGKKVYLELNQSYPLLQFIYFNGFYRIAEKFSDTFFCKAIEYHGSIQQIDSGTDFLIDFMSFDSKNDFLEFLSTEKMKFTSLSDTITTTDLLKKQEIKSIILRELGLNTFEHNLNQPAFMLVVKKSKRNLLKSKVLPDFVNDRIKEISSDKIIQATTVDLGIGIVKTLKESLLKNKLINNQTSDHSILEMAFEKFTSKKDRSEQERVFPNEPNYPDLVLPSGLYFVIEYVKEQRGIILLQSCGEYIGKSFVSGKEELIFSDKFVAVPHGTSVTILIPSKAHNLKEAKAPEVIVKTSPPEIKKIISWKYINHSEEDGITNFSDEDSTNNFIEKIHLAISENRINSEDYGIIVDLEGCEVQIKYLNKIVINCLYLSKRNVVIFNIPSNSLSVKTLFAMSRHSENIIDMTFNEVFWVKEKEVGTLSWKRVDNSQEIDLCEIEDEIEKYNLNNIRRSVEECFEPEKKVEIPFPSHVYTRGYYALDKALVRKKFCYSVADLIFSKLNQFDLIIQTSKTLETITSALLAKANLPKTRYYTVTPSTPNVEAINKIHSFAVTKAVLILTDVSLTGKTLKRIRNSIPDKLKTFTVAILANSDNHHVDHSLFQREMAFYDTPPKEWRRTDLVKVNTLNNTLEENESHSAQLVDSAILNRWSLKNALISGHFSDSKRCLTSYLSPKGLVEIYQNVLVRHISKIISMHDNVPEKPMYVLIHRELDHESKFICSKVEALVEKRITTESFTKDDFDIEAVVPLSKAVQGTLVYIFIDMAVASGETIKLLIEHAASKKASDFYSCSLIDRSQSREFSFINSIERYKGMNVSADSIFKVALPLYERHCPVCILREKVDFVLEHSDSTNLRQNAKRWHERLEELPTSKVQISSGLESIGNKINYTNGSVAYFKHIITLLCKSHMSKKTTDISYSDRVREHAASIKSSDENLVSFIDTFWHEGLSYSDEVFSNAPYKPLIKILIDVSVPILYEQHFSFEHKAKCLWLIASLDFPFLVDMINNSPRILVNNIKLYETYLLISCSFRNQANIEDILVSLESPFRNSLEEFGAIFELYKKVYIEAKCFLEHHKSTPSQGSFHSLLSTLNSILAEKNNSHSNAVKLYRAWAEAYDTESLLANLHHKKHFDNYFQEVTRAIKMLVDILDLKNNKSFIKHIEPADISYLTSNQFEQDFIFISSSLEDIVQRAERGNLSKEYGNNIIDEKILPIRKKFGERIVHDSEENIIFYLLKHCKSKVDDIIEKTIDEFKQKNASSNIRFDFSKKGRSFLSYTPIFVTTDVIRTVVENACNYSIPNGKITLYLQKSGDNLKLIISNTSDSTIEYKNKHGLVRAKNSILRFDGDLSIGKDLIDSVVEVKLPIMKKEWSYQHESSF